MEYIIYFVFGNETRDTIRVSGKKHFNQVINEMAESGLYRCLEWCTTVDHKWHTHYSYYNDYTFQAYLNRPRKDHHSRAPE